MPSWALSLLPYFPFPGGASWSQMGDKRKIVRGQEDMNPHPYSVFNVVLIVSFVK
jgi:hypothetical protein